MTVSAATRPLLAFCHEGLTSVFNPKVRETPSISAQCRLLKNAGFDGIALAPAAFGTNIALMSRRQLRSLWNEAQGEGIQIVELHWLLAMTDGLHLTKSDRASATIDYFRKLAGAAGMLGATRLVLGSPKQRSFDESMQLPGAMNNAARILKAVGPDFAANNCELAVEFLAPAETNFINTAQQAMELVGMVGHPAVGLHLDIKAIASTQADSAGVVSVVEAFAGKARHFHLNDADGRCPGTNASSKIIDFAAVIRAALRAGYTGWFSVEPFDFILDGGLEDPSRMVDRSMKTVCAAVEEALSA